MANVKRKVRPGTASAAHLSTAILLVSLGLFGCGSGGGGEEFAPGSPAGAATATLAWDAVQAATLSGYRIYYGTSPGLYFQSPGNGLAVGRDATAYVVTGLSSGTTYYFAATAFDTSGNESAYSEEVSKAIP
jgi:hypothetical protein